jgi:hypothetical protein
VPGLPATTHLSFSWLCTSAGKFIHSGRISGAPLLCAVCMAV